MLRLHRTLLAKPSHISRLCSSKPVKNKYSHTVLLPQTLFSQRANAVEREPETQKWWRDNKIYEQFSTEAAEDPSNPKPTFLLHDGPPYANGDLHMGHALNKILKDFINRYQIMKGKRVTFVPGWDCHGLPIEMKVLQTLKPAEKKALSPIELRKIASTFARGAVETQKASFKRYGVWGHWDGAYDTMIPSYEARQICVFGDMLSKGYIYRGKKPVHWSPSSQSALAEAELEYSDVHVSKSVYVAFRVHTTSPQLERAVALCMEEGGVVGTPATVDLTIWTTTPWTLPSNAAIAVHKDICYALVNCSSETHPNPDSHFYVVAVELVKEFGEQMGGTAVVRGMLSGSDLVSSAYTHPLCCDVHSITRDGDDSKTSPASDSSMSISARFPHLHTVLLGGDYITTASGTGLVHIAPGHGQQDFDIGRQFNLPVLTAVNDYGKFTEEVSADPAVVEALRGKAVLTDGNEAVIAHLREIGVLLNQTDYKHKYPYDWRTKKPIIMRATEQWFASVAAFREDVMEAIETVKWVPDAGKRRIISMTNSRGDWCISRQRLWGVPIPVFYHTETGVPLINAATIAHIANLFEKGATNKEGVHVSGSNVWWDLDVAELLPEEFRAEATNYRRGFDTMDVWFDSGTSWSGVLGNCGEFSGLSAPADLYLEGSDQHRGWFQSSLLTSVAVCGAAPYRAVLTHGFVLDERGQKMSKSLGNVVDPYTIINGGAAAGKGKGKGGKGKGGGALSPAYGADTLRLWVASVDYRSDVCIGGNIMQAVSESYRKIRNSLRFILGSLNDFDPSASTGHRGAGRPPVELQFDQLPSFDQYMLLKLDELGRRVEQCYEQYDFAGATTLLSGFLNADMSAFYLDVCKDRLYISRADEVRRRQCQFVLAQVLESVTVMLAPILPHLAEEVWQYVPYLQTTAGRQSVFQKRWIDLSSSVLTHPQSEGQSELVDRMRTVAVWDCVRQLRQEINVVLERARRDKVIGSSADAQCVLSLSGLDSDGEAVRACLEQLLPPQQGLHTPTSSDARIDAALRAENVEGVAFYGVDDLRYVLKVSQVGLLPVDTGGDAESRAHEIESLCPTYNDTVPITLQQRNGDGSVSTITASVTIGVKRASGKQCERCWFYCESVGKANSTNSDSIGLCTRCAHTISSI